ncbi:CYTH domain-containing protein [Alkalicoccus saliphilus]|uniref:CYTH domain-containing protein n=1 Tax=Alkalicoccus saliphilus TaxID=200989 RepID=A0A2T4U9W7_9BACI|nr:CYTH domain-containing protein [Alkalicoccus saliphilus]PTL40182.1 CYTH domain-containing protein [Alkalicoccus saliphilus]
MTQEIEIEFKQLIDEKTYQEMMDYYQDKLTFTQVNHYFETSSLGLKQLGAALRVREKDNGYVLTLKQPHETGGLLETHQEIGSSAFTALQQKGLLPQGETTDQLITLLGTMPELQYLGMLQTERLETELDEGILVLDRSDYVNVTDFELEFECRDEVKGKEAFNKLLQKWNLTWNQPDNKIARFYKAAFE